MDEFNKVVVSVKNHITRNRAKYAVVGTLIACYNVHRVAVREWDGFLEEHDLKDEYYTALEED